MKEKFIEFKNVFKKYPYDGGKIVALNDISFDIKEGELVIILGDSGAGKSTALNILGGMDYLSLGEVLVDSRNISKMNDDELTKYRKEDIGFVFQFYNLIPNLTVFENVELASKLSKNPLDPKEVLTSVGLGERFNNLPGQISGGEQQRASIARAIVKNPKLLLCDEPTGALDYKTGKLILGLLQEINKKYNKTVIIITHNSLIKGIGDRVITFKSGQISDITINENPSKIEELEW